MQHTIYIYDIQLTIEIKITDTNDKKYAKITIILSVISPDNVKTVDIFLSIYPYNLFRAYYDRDNESEEFRLDMQKCIINNIINKFNIISYYYLSTLKNIFYKYLPIDIDNSRKKILNIIRSPNKKCYSDGIYINDEKFIKNDFINLCDDLYNIIQNSIYTIKVQIDFDFIIKYYWECGDEYTYAFDNNFLYRISPEFSEIKKISIDKIFEKFGKNKQNEDLNNIKIISIFPGKNIRLELNELKITININEFIQ